MAIFTTPNLGQMHYQSTYNTGINQFLTEHENSPNVLRWKGEVEAAGSSLKPGKSPGVYTITLVLISNGGEGIILALITLCQMIW